MVQRKESVEDQDTWKERGIKREKRRREREECRKFEREKKEGEKRKKREDLVKSFKAKGETSDFGLGNKPETNLGKFS